MDSGKPLTVTVVKSDQYQEYQVKTVAWSETTIGRNPVDPSKDKPPADNPAGEGPTPDSSDQPAEPKFVFRQEVARLRGAGWKDEQLQPIIQLCTGGTTPFDESPVLIQRLVLDILAYLPERWPQVADVIRTATHDTAIATLPPERIQAMRSWVAKEFTKAHPSAPPAPSDEVQL
jgi:hypothetical protein